MRDTGCAGHPEGLATDVTSGAHNDAGTRQRNVSHPPHASTAMDWKTDATGRSYTGTEGDYQTLVWRTSTREWAAMVSQSHIAFAHTRCVTLKDALAWCETQLAACSVQDRSTK